MLKILGRKDSSNVQKVLWLLDEMGMPFEQEDYGGRFGGNTSADYLRLNPNGRIPTLLDGPVVVWESNTILRYIANRYGPTPLYPTDPVLRSECERWMDWQLGTLNVAMGPLYIALVRTPIEERDIAAVRRNEQRAAELFAVLDGELAERRHVAGTDLSLADIATGILAYRWFALDVARGKPTPHLQRWLEQLGSRRAFKERVMIPLS
jgi:glutathione S-transferase